MADSAGEFPWLYEENLTNSFYQRKYPTRLPKLPGTHPKTVELDETETKTKKRDQIKISIESEEKMMSRFAREHLFAKREIKEQPTMEIKEKNIKSDQLMIEDYLEENELDEEIKKLQLDQDASFKMKKQKGRSNSEIPHTDLMKFIREASGISPKEKSKTNSPVSAGKKKTFQAVDIIHVSPTKKWKNKKRPSTVTAQNLKGGTNSSKQRSVNTSLKKDLQRQDARKHFLSELRSKGESAVIKNITKTVKASKEKPILNPRHGQKKFNTPVYLTRITPKTSPRQGMKMTYLKSKVPVKMLGCQTKHQSSKNKEAPKEPKIEKSENVEEAVFPKEDMGEEEKVKVKKLSDKELFFSTAKDEQMTLLEDKNTKLTVHRDANEKVKGEPISFIVAKALRLLLFGSSVNSFNGTWRDQTLVFHREMHYGLKFYKDGPSGIMACLQALIMKQLLFINTDPNQFDLTVRLKPDVDVQKRALCHAICDMIWKAGSKQHAVVALPLGDCTFITDSSYRVDKLTEKMELFKFTNSDELEKFIKWNLNLFQDFGMSGCISLLYSMMLSRGLLQLFQDCSEVTQGILETFDDEAPVSRSQVLINFCIYGSAVPNVFNGELEEKDEYGQLVLKKGIKKRCEIGFITHEEFSLPKKCIVGSCLKTPLYPIWVVNNNNRIGVLFSLKKDLLNDWKLERRFDLYFYQGIPRYVSSVELDVKFTIDTILPLIENEYEEDDNSTIEETIRTKWMDAVIEWNGYTRF